MYGMVMGERPEATLLVGLVRAHGDFEVGRYRDAWVERYGDILVIRIHTRNGGGNREYHESEIESMRAHPWFLRDADDDYDCTYADFYFTVDVAAMSEHKELLEFLVEAAVDPVDNGERWNAAIEAFKNMPIPAKETPT